jgi:ribosomal protein S10
MVDVKPVVSSSHRVRIKIRAYDHKIIDQATKMIIETAERASEALAKVTEKYEQSA